MTKAEAPFMDFHYIYTDRKVNVNANARLIQTHTKRRHTTLQQYGIDLLMQCKCMKGAPALHN